MLIGDVFNYIKSGLDTKKVSGRVSELTYFKRIKKNSMKNVKFIESRFSDFEKINHDINQKYMLHKDDIVISLKIPYSVACLSEELDYNVLIPNHYVVLRNINSEKYNCLFVANYLNIVGIENLVDKLRYQSDLTLYDIEGIKLPDISLEKQESIIALCDSINEKALCFEKIKDNDNKIIEYAMKEVFGDINV